MKGKNIDLNLRPKFHITGGKGWINDPNGLVRFHGKYHVFFQYYPYATEWGPMHWGHVVSDDLTHWQYLPIALAPGDSYDKDGCFSGSAIVWRDKIWVLYTGFSKTGDCIEQVQCLASSDDGENFVKYGVVMARGELPEEYALCDFRDPKIWQKDGEFRCVVAARRQSGRGRVLLFRSDDLFKWQFVGDVLGEDSKGIMTECPDYRDDLKLLTLCEQFQPREDSKHLNVHSTRWYTGVLDCESGKFSHVNGDILDYGFDFYAPQTFCDEPVMIGWLNMWDRNNPAAKYGFAGMLTVPRKLEIVDGSLCQTPVVAARKAYEKEVNGSFKDKIKVGVIKITAENLEKFEILLRKAGGIYTSFKLDGGEWIFDRSRSGEEIRGVEKDGDSVAGIRRMPCDGAAKTDIIIVLDEFSVEIFVNGKALSSTVYPPQSAEDLALSVSATAAKIIRFEV